MSISLINPKFSFVKFGLLNQNYSLPVADDGDLAFQVFIETDTSGNADNLMSSDCFLGLFPPGLTIGSNAEYVALSLTIFSDLMLPFRIGSTTVLLYWPHGLPDFKSFVANDDCFQLVLKIAHYSSPGFFSSNSFHRTNSEYTSLMKYSCEENAFDFNYCADPSLENRVRLYLHLRRPQMPEEKSIHMQSSGRRKVLKYSISAEFEGVTELFNYQVHEALNMALSHDYIYVKGKHYDGSVVKNTGYEIEWPEFSDFDLAPAKVKLIATPYNWRNGNCAECAPYNPICDISISIKSIVLTDLSSGQACAYQVDWENSGGVPNEVLIAYSLDSITWQVDSFSIATDKNSASFSVEQSQEFQIPFFLRLIPVCTGPIPGTPQVFYYSLDYSQNFTAADIDGTSFRIATGFSAGVSYDLSIDGGLTYLATAITNSDYVVTGLTPATTYNVVRRMHSINGITQVLYPVPVTTL